MSQSKPTTPAENAGAAPKGNAGLPSKKFKKRSGGGRDSLPPK